MGPFLVFYVLGGYGLNMSLLSPLKEFEPVCFQFNFITKFGPGPIGSVPEGYHLDPDPTQTHEKVRVWIRSGFK